MKREMLSRLGRLTAILKAMPAGVTVGEYIYRASLLLQGAIKDTR
jgi:hypothetical protein